MKVKGNYTPSFCFAEQARVCPCSLSKLLLSLIVLGSGALEQGTGCNGMHARGEGPLDFEPPPLAYVLAP